MLAGALREAVERGATVVFSSCQVELVERLCDSVTILERGALRTRGKLKLGEALAAADRP